jgi:hypothetical protein
MSSQFAHLKEYDPVDREAVMTLPLQGSPKLRMKYAGIGNKRYVNALAARTTANAAKQRAMDASGQSKDSLNADRELFPECVVVGWEDVLNVEGDPVEFSVENCADFFRQLPDWIMRRVSTWASTPTNFIDPSQIVTKKEISDQAGE